MTLGPGQTWRELVAERGVGEDDAAFEVAREHGALDEVCFRAAQEPPSNWLVILRKLARDDGDRILLGDCQTALGLRPGEGCRSAAEARCREIWNAIYGDMP